MKSEAPSVSFTRSEAVADAWQSLAMESLDPGPEVRQLADRYAQGELTVAELSAALDQLESQTQQDA